MSELERRLGYTFRNKDLLKHALTHSSYANEKQTPERSNERLEFLGDAVLSVIVSDYLYKEHPDFPEGELTRLRSSLVCEEALHGYSGELGLGEFLLLGKGERLTGGGERPSILADTFEAVLAAIYLDGGMEPARQHVLRFVVKAEESHPVRSADYKTALQEFVQRDPAASVRYELAGESGPDHNKVFTVNALRGDEVIGTGSGHSKKQAEQDAARHALEHLRGE